MVFLIGCHLKILLTRFGSLFRLKTSEVLSLSLVKEQLARFVATHLRE